WTGLPGTTQDVSVRPDGYISVVGVRDNILATGLTPEELQDAIEKGMKASFPGVGDVRVIVATIQNYREFVTGKVVKPGAITSEQQINILQAVALTGGFQKTANPADMTIVSSDGKISTKFSYDEVIARNPSIQNIPELKSGDVVFVP